MEDIRRPTAPDLLPMLSTACGLVDPIRKQSRIDRVRVVRVRGQADGVGDLGVAKEVDCAAGRTPTRAAVRRLVHATA